jgi:elongation factor Ts
MANITATQIAALRAKTGLGMMECKKALVEAGGDMDKAIEILKKSGAAKAMKRMDRETGEGIVESYVHTDGRIGVIVEVLAETDFVAKNDEFKAFAHDVALHIAAMNPRFISHDQVPADEVAKERQNFTEEVMASGKPKEIADKIIEGKLAKYLDEICLLNQPFVKDPAVTINDLLTEKIAKIGEKITISRFCRFEIGVK